MVEGRVQVGDQQYDDSFAPAEVNIAGDPGQRPTYADIDRFDLRTLPARAEGALVNEWFGDDGITPILPNTFPDFVYATYRVTVPGLDHTVAAPFWDFMNATGLVYESGLIVTAPLFQNPFYATGYPITEAYWSFLHVGGQTRPILWQCFERRCLTYTPDNPPGWQVEAGNVGLHYHQWRYGTLPLLAFTSTRSGDGDIYLVDVHGGGLRQLTEGPELDIQPAWSPDGRQIVFVRRHWDVFGRVTGGDIYVVNADGSGLRKLTNHAGGFAFPTWSPDGSQIAFGGGGGQLPEIWMSSVFIVNADGSGLTNLTGHAGSFGMPTWSPDGSRLAFEGGLPTDAEGGIFMVNTDGSGLVRLSNGYGPSWSPDGTRIAFLNWSDDDGGSLAVINWDGSDYTPLIKNIFSNTHSPSWSPDGTQIAFFHAPHGHAQIHVINADGSGLLAVTDSGGDRRDLIPVWSPDGTRIAFTAIDDHDNHDVWVVRPDGTGLTNLSNHPAADVQPAWQGGGQGSRP
jgi:Tol biopolymer transport system component